MVKQQIDSKFIALAENLTINHVGGEYNIETSKSQKNVE